MPRLGGGVHRPPALGRMPRHMSFSQLRLLAGAYETSCARQWAYRYLAHLPEKTGIGLICGDALDAGLNRLYGFDLPNDIEAAVRAASKRFDQRIDEAVFDKHFTTQEFVAYRDKIVEALRAVAIHEAAAKLGDGIPRVASVQWKHTFTVRARDNQRIISMIGYSDRIDTDGTIVDHKWTGSRPVDDDGNWKEAWLRPKIDQLVVYWLSRAAEERRGVDQPAPVVPLGRIVAAYHRVNMKEPQVLVYETEFTNDDAARVIELIRICDDALQVKRFPARPGEHCRFCPFLAQCRTDEAARGASFNTLVGVEA